MGTLRRIAGVVTGAAALVATAVAVAPSAEAAGAPPCGARARACLELHSNTAWLMDGGKVTYTAPVTTGKRGHETPVGTFKVQYKDIDHYSKQYNGPMPYSVFFTTDGVAFHQGSLKRQSHGCVHLSHQAAVKFFSTLQVGDVVQVVK